MSYPRQDKANVMLNRSSNYSIASTFIVAAIMGGLWVAAYRFAPTVPPLIMTSVLFTALVAISWFDFDHFRIPDWINYPLILAGLILAATGYAHPFAWHLLGAIAGYGLIRGLNVWWKRFRGREGIGMGDAKLLAAAGAWVGIAALPLVTLVASTLALVWVLVGAGLRGGMRQGSEFPFGPFLSVGFFAVWVLSVLLPFSY